MAQELGAENWQASLATRVTMMARTPVLGPRPWGSPQWQGGRIVTLLKGAPAASNICSQGNTINQGSEASGYPYTACTSLVKKATASP